MNPPTQTDLENAALVLAKIATADQWAAKPDPAMMVTWAECFAVHGLQRQDLLDGTIRYYADDTRDKTNRTLPADIIRAARAVRRDRYDRETPDQRRLREAKLDAKILQLEGK